MNILVFLIYTGFVTFASLRPMDSVSIGNWDKAGHLVLYFVFALLGHRVVANPKHYLYLSVGIIAYSGLMEIAQSFMPGRMMSAYDLLANGVGVGLAVLLIRMQLSAKNI